MDIVRRPLAERVLRPPAARVTIIEGARAVGKTTMVTHELVPQGYSYQSLASPATLALARADLEPWLAHLELPAIIDEAQLLPGLPLAVKERVDGLGRANSFVLTGSASIGRHGLGGADPLVRRAQRFTLRPLTGWELSRTPGCLVDWLFDADIAPARLAPVPEETLRAHVSIGGFPDYALATPPPAPESLSRWVQSDITGLLTDTVLPETDYSAMIARAVLNGLLTLPGSIFNASRLSGLLGVDRRTIDRYLGILGRLFLVHWLPNLAVAPQRQDHTRAKVHPVDSSFAVAALRASGVDLATNRELFGQVVESWVVNQIVAAGDWASTAVSAHYWRDSATAQEVDLVLTDERGRRLGIEVKASRVYDSHQIRGLRALEHDRGLHRGFVVYLGDELFPVAENIWLLPVSVLTSGPPS